MHVFDMFILRKNTDLEWREEGKLLYKKEESEIRISEREQFIYKRPLTPACYFHFTSSFSAIYYYYRRHTLPLFLCHHCIEGHASIQIYKKTNKRINNIISIKYNHRIYVSLVIEWIHCIHNTKSINYIQRYSQNEFN